MNKVNMETTEKVLETMRSYSERGGMGMIYSLSKELEIEG